MNFYKFTHTHTTHDFIVVKNVMVNETKDNFVVGNFSLLHKKNYKLLSHSEKFIALVSYLERI